MANGAAVTSLLLGLPIQLLRVAPQAHGGLLRQRRELNGLGRAAGPDRMRGVGLLCQVQQAGQKCFVGYGHGHASSGWPRAAVRGTRKAKHPRGKTGLAFFAAMGDHLSDEIRRLSPGSPGACGPPLRVAFSMSWA